MTEKEFEKKWIDQIKDGLLKFFPDDYLTDEETIEVKLPGKALTIGSEFFGSFEIVDTHGFPHFQADDYSKAKYILYANRAIPKSIKQPAQLEAIKRVVKEHEVLLDNLVKEIAKDFKQCFPDSPRIHNCTNNIFAALNLQRY
ncbi:MAG: hypothetical protein KJ799_18735 [Bacteroidetes bacterium]|nr:hypothetical protein [Bacteroidota bacterium]MBU2508735.1 hypothetical protein [Bacteroidota bacterium]